MIHEPVLLRESVDFLITKIDGIYFDGTAGFGGHATEILKKISSKGQLIATDKDQSAFEHCKRLFSGDARYSIFNTSFKNIDTISKIEFIENFDGIFTDLGVSSFQLDNIDAGFTFREDASLDLRMNKQEGFSASEFLNTATQEEIANVIFEFGEEKKSRGIARKIVEFRNSTKIERTFQLKKIVEEVTPQRFVTKSLSRVFQALRIYVNNELDELRTFIDKSVPLLSIGGRIAIITFHSLEDRIVKEKFKYESLSCICPPEMPICTCGKKQTLKLITGKPVIPTENEVEKNRRSRSAKLRVAEKV
jgi:16S rRNA (cytosine1402-N4)-methyltransferase